MPLLRLSSLQRRETPKNSSTYIWIALAALAISIIILIGCVNLLRKRRATSQDPPKLLPKFLHQRWREWQPVSYAPVSTPLEAQQRSRLDSTRTTSLRDPDEIDRRTSVRSIMTLPAYHTTPLPSERLIAREGERAGVDTVVEYPETEDIAEARREQEMATLFNIRQARRREQEEREERRQQRREARETGNWQRLEELERESRARAQERQNRDQTILGQMEAAEAENGATEQDSGFLIAELQAMRERNSRGRRVSSVSYAELGTARHDGSRIRAGSFESDNHPLLDSAASIGQRSRATSRASSAGRGPSISIDNGLSSPGFGRPMTGQTGHTRHVSEGGASYLDDEDHSATRPPMLTPQSSEELPLNPPSYDDDLSVHGGEAPPYESPVERRPSPFAQNRSSQRSQRSQRTIQRRGTEDEELRDEVRIAQEFLAHGDSENSSPTADTPTGSSEGRSNAGDPQEHVNLSSSQSQSTKSPSLRLETQPRVPPQLEVISATPVSTAPNSPIDGRTGSRDRD